MYRSLTAQTLHYFARPHWNVRRTPIAGVAAWRGAELAGQTSWRVALSPRQIEELERAIESARATGRPTRSLRRRDFPLPTLTREIDRWRRDMIDGRGFVVLGGLPVERWGVADTELFFWCFGLHLGTPGAQNPQGDLLGHVRDLGDDPREVRAYRTSSTIAYHCDAANIVGLLCLSRAKRGGLSRIVSSVTVYNELVARRPNLVKRLYEPFLLDTHGEGGVDYFAIPPARHLDGRLRTFWHADYFRSALEYTERRALRRSRRRAARTLRWYRVGARALPGHGPGAWRRAALEQPHDPPRPHRVRGPPGTGAAAAPAAPVAVARPGSLGARARARCAGLRGPRAAARARETAPLVRRRIAPPRCYFPWVFLN